MNDQSPLPFPAAAVSEQSNAVVWDNFERESEAGSVRTTSSVLRRQTWKQRREEEKAVNLAQLMAQEAARDAQLEVEMDQADAESVAQGHVTEPSTGRGEAENCEVLRRRIESKRADLAREEALFYSLPSLPAPTRDVACGGSTAEPLFIPDGSSSPLKYEEQGTRRTPELTGRVTRSSPIVLPSSSTPLAGSRYFPAHRSATPFDPYIASVANQPHLEPPTDEEIQATPDGSFKRLSAPKAWMGHFDHNLREDWITSASAYLASHGVGGEAWLSMSNTPAAYYAMRTLFDMTAGTSRSISPSSWFSNFVRAQPVFCPEQVWAAMRSQWPNHQAAERSYLDFRNATQGTMNVVEFGSHIQFLANRCWTPISDLDLRTGFLNGLRPEVRNYVKTVQTTQELNASLLGQEIEYSFYNLRHIASVFDQLEPTAATRTSTTPGRVPSSSPVPNSCSSKTRADYTSPSPLSPVSPSRAGSPATPDSWRTQALEFQSKHPLSEKASWQKLDARPTGNTIRCWNCGRNGTHISVACPNARKDPRQVTVAVLRFASSSLAPSSPSPAGTSPRSPLSQSVVDGDLSGDSGKGSDEES